MVEHDGRHGGNHGGNMVENGILTKKHVDLNLSLIYS